MPQRPLIIYGSFVAVAISCYMAAHPIYLLLIFLMSYTYVMIIKCCLGMRKNICKMPIIELNHQSFSYYAFEYNLDNFAKELVRKSIKWEYIHYIEIGWGKKKGESRGRYYRLVIHQYNGETVAINCDDIMLRPSELFKIFCHYKPIQKKMAFVVAVYDIWHQWGYVSPVILGVAITLIS
jgi:hypothetical protein